MFPVSQLLGTPLKQSTLNHSAAEFETSNTTHTSAKSVFLFLFIFFYVFLFFMRTQNQQPTQTVAVLVPTPFASLQPIPSLTGNYPNSGIAWDAWYMHLVSFAVRLLRVCIMISTFLAALSAGSCNKHLSRSLSLSVPLFACLCLCPALCVLRRELSKLSCYNFIKEGIRMTNT